jgi:hypothetical protein
MKAWISEMMGWTNEEIRWVIEDIRLANEDIWWEKEWTRRTNEGMRGQIKGWISKRSDGRANVKYWWAKEGMDEQKKEWMIKKKECNR